MDVIEAILARKSVRAFRPTPVPKEVLEKVLEVAIRAPSWSNTQPWEFAVFSGPVMDAIRKELVEKATAQVSPYPDIPRPNFTGARELSREQGKAKRLRWLGIDPGDEAAVQKYDLRSPNFFGAPCGLILFMDRSLGGFSMLDIGLLAQTIALAAVGHGLGTCLEAAVVRFPDVLRRHLPIPDTKQIVVGMSIGYPDESDPINKYRSDREPLANITTWHGFE
ncbi:MAG: nitroreductase [Chloroflexi bacterium]|nr:nitroreductase [Chloroflexota bacterium]